jgi:superfamily II DNA or RNA helicase
LVVLPTGSGKTVIVAEEIRRAVARGERVLFLCHRRELTKQAAQKLYDVGIDAGIIQAGFLRRPSERVQVASIQTLHFRAMRSRTIDLPPADLVIVDEAHHALANTWRRLIEAYPRARIIGLTATPCRADGRGLGNIFEALIEGSGVAELVEQKFLVPTVVYEPVRPDLSGIQVRRGDYAEDQLAARMNTAQLVGDIVEHWHRIAQRRRTVVFAVNVAHSVHLRDEFRLSRVLAEHIDGETPIEERDAILAKLATGQVEIVTNCQVLTEGWDCPEVSCIVLARPTKSLGLYRQMTGRTLRPAAGKVNALVLDHAGAVFQHGFVDDPIDWALHEDRRAENKAHAARGTNGHPSLVDCPECHAIRFQGQPCPACGWRPRPKAVPVEVAEGELVAVGRDNHTARPPVADTMWDSAARRKFYSELLWIERERQYRRGFAAHKYREKFNSWPDGMCAVEPTLPSDAVLSWVRSRQIAYARAQDKAKRAS